MKEKLLEDLMNQELPEYEKKYIVAVVEYIDSNIQRIETEKANFDAVVQRMLELVRNVNNCCTGVSYIDDIVVTRKQSANGVAPYTVNKSGDFRTGNDKYGFVQNYIAIISNYGGLFKYICDTYQEELEQEIMPSMEPTK